MRGTDGNSSRRWPGARVVEGEFLESMKLVVAHSGAWMKTEHRNVSGSFNRVYNL